MTYIEVLTNDFYSSSSREVFLKLYWIEVLSVVSYKTTIEYETIEMKYSQKPF